MGDTLWNLYILVTMAQVPPLLYPWWWLVLNLHIQHLTLRYYENINSESWA